MIQVMTEYGGVAIAAGERVSVVIGDRLAFSGTQKELEILLGQHEKFMAYIDGHEEGR